MRRTLVAVGSLLAIGHVLLGAENLPPVDGVVVSIRNEAGTKGEELVCYTLKAGKTTGSATIFKADDQITSACVSPFGNQVAFIKPGGTVAVAGMDGKDARELADDALWVQWPASDGGRWVYYMDAKDKVTLRRVNVKTKETQAVVTFDRAIPIGVMSQDASPDSGWCLFPGGDSGIYVSVYPMARGTGSAVAVPEWFSLRTDQYRALCISPDNTCFGLVGLDGSFLLIDLPADENPLYGFRLDPRNPAPNAYEEDRTRALLVAPTYLRRSSKVEEELGFKQACLVQPVWAVDHPGWILFSKLNYADAPDLGKKPLSSGLVLWDVAAGAHHGIPNNIVVSENRPGIYERTVGFWQWLPAEYSLGYYRGKAPYTVSFDDDRLQDERTWDFGDGSPRVKGRTVKHTYTKEGHFLVVAEKGAWAKPLREHVTHSAEGLYMADVTVRAPGKAEASVHCADANHVLVKFSEPMQAKDAQVSVGRNKVQKWQLLASGRWLAIQTAEPVTDGESVNLKGFRDLAQEPSPLHSETLKVSVPAWPSDRRKLVFLWEDINQCNAYFNRPASSIQVGELFRDGPKDGAIDALGRLNLGQAAMRTSMKNTGQIGSGDLAEVTLDSTLSFECTFQPDDLTQHALRRPRRIVSLGAHRIYVASFEIGQQNNRLLVALRTADNWQEDMGQPLDDKINPKLKPEERKGTFPYFYGHAPWIEVATLKDTKAHHLVVTYKPNLMVVYLDGEKVHETDRVTGSLNWGWGMLLLGGHHWLDGSSDRWRGTLEGVAMYSRCLEAAEVKRNFEAYAKKVEAREESLSQSGKKKGAT